MQKPALLILAAGMGSRYGGLKQVDRFGPAGETIIEYSIYDALRAGFKDIIVVVRKEFINEFRQTVLARAMLKADIQFAFQELENLPPGFKLPAQRVKPWGTGHAVLSAKEQMTAPFAVINADDFYGKESYKIIFNFLLQHQNQKPEEYCLVDYQLLNTLSESGTVSRGICRVDKNDYLTEIVEHKKIGRFANEIVSITGDESHILLTPKERVSMNLMGFMPSFMEFLHNQFIKFLQNNIENPASEFFLPIALNEAIISGFAKIKVLSTHEKWFGVTYREDRNMVVNSIKHLIDTGVYPADLWA
jgi:UTP-glucose-1-phosphate uridylyltransferase